MSRHFGALDLHSAETVPAGRRLCKSLNFMRNLRFRGIQEPYCGVRQLETVQHNLCACVVAANTEFVGADQGWGQVRRSDRDAESPPRHAAACCITKQKAAQRKLDGFGSGVRLPTSVAAALAPPSAQNRPDGVHAMLRA
jgi:hypothetical protein